MGKPYSRLRHALDDADISRQDIANRLGRSIVYVNQRFRCEFPWTMSDAYEILEMLKEPAEKLAELFPNERIKRC